MSRFAKVGNESSKAREVGQAVCEGEIKKNGSFANGRILKAQLSQKNPGARAT